jgi:hypothetical protein
MAPELWDIINLVVSKVIVRAVLQIPHVISLKDEKGPMRRVEPKAR